MAVTEEVITKFIADVGDFNAKFTEMENRLKTQEAAFASLGKKGKESLADTGKEADNLSKKLSGDLSSSLTKIGGLIVTAFSVHQIIAFGKATVEAFVKAELSAKKLQTAVGAGGGLQKDFEVLIQQSKELQKTTIFNDETIQDAQTMALQFGLNAQAVKDLIPLIIDFASATGQDLGSALSTVLRGTTGQTRGLKVYGIEVDSSATRTQKFTSIVQQLTDKFQGQGKVVGETVGGRLKQLSNAWDELKESIGGALAPLVSGAAELAKSFLSIAETPLSEKLQDERIQLELTGIKLSSLNEGSKERSDIIKKLQSQYPDYLKNIDAEKVSNEDLQKALRKVNDQLVLKIALAKGDEEIVGAQEKVADALLKTSKQEGILISQIRQRLEQAQKSNPVLAEELKARLQGLSLDQQAILIQKSGLDASGKIIESVNNRVKSEGELKIAQDELAKSQKKRIEEEQRLRGILNIPITEEKLSSGGDFLKKTDEEIKAEQEAAKKVAEAREKAEKEVADKIAEIKEDNFKLAEENLKKFHAEQISQIENSNKDREDKELAFAQLELDVLNARRQNYIDYGKEIGEIDIQIANKHIELNKAKEKSDQEFLELQQSIDDELIKQADELQGRLDEIAEESAERQKQLLEDVFNLSQELLQTASEAFDSADDAELDRINERADARIDAIDQQIEALEDANKRGQLSDKQLEERKKKLVLERAAIEKKAVEEENKLKRKEAERDKLLSLFRIGLILAEAIALGNVFRAIAAAAQLAVVAATPIPTFARGTKGKDKPGIGLVGEQGAEFIYMPQGTQVLPADKTRKHKEMLNAMMDNNLEQYLYKVYIAPALIEASKKAEEKRTKGFAENIANSFKTQSTEWDTYHALQNNNKAAAQAIGEVIAKKINNGYKNPYYR